MIKTINTQFPSKSGDMSNMYLEVYQRVVSYPNPEKIIYVQYRYYLLVDGQNTEQSTGNLMLGYAESQHLLDKIVESGVIDTEGKSNDDILDEVLPYMLIEYMKTNIDENGKTPYAIPCDDWEVYIKEVLPIIE